MANPVSNALSKLPWYGQIGVFIVLSAILAGVFYYYVETPAQEAMALAREARVGPRATGASFAAS